MIKTFPRDRVRFQPVLRPKIASQVCWIYPQCQRRSRFSFLCGTIEGSGFYCVILLRLRGHCSWLAGLRFVDVCILRLFPLLYLNWLENTKKTWFGKDPVNRMGQKLTFLVKIVKRWFFIISSQKFENPTRLWRTRKVFNWTHLAFASRKCLAGYWKHRWTSLALQEGTNKKSLKFVALIFVMQRPNEVN